MAEARPGPLVAGAAMVLVGVVSLVLGFTRVTAGTHREPPGARPGAHPLPATTAARPLIPVATVPAPADVDPAWINRTSAATGIPGRALAAYARASRAVPQCQLGWNALAAIGEVESDHGRTGGSALGSDGVARPAIVGIPLDGRGVAAIRDTDRGRLDDDPRWDRAVGPMQFIPSTWAQWGSDGNRDGIADPQQVDDAALSAARYLCGSGGRLDTDEGWRAAVLAYNSDLTYLDRVTRIATDHLRRAP